MMLCSLLRSFRRRERGKLLGDQYRLRLVRSFAFLRLWVLEMTFELQDDGDGVGDLVLICEPGRVVT